MHFTKEELATVLAALRYWQRTIISTPGPFPSEDALPEMIYFGDEEPITAEELDDLCERVNTDCYEQVDRKRVSD
jgi:hypothetical protein